MNTNALIALIARKDQEIEKLQEDNLLLEVSLELEQIERAAGKETAASAPLKLHHGSREDHYLKGFIEDALAATGAISFDDVDVGAVWRWLVAAADTDRAPEHVIGYVPAKRSIKYRGKGYERSGQFDHFNREALAQLFRRQKVHANPR
jgi:hypothetical protein